MASRVETNRNPKHRDEVVVPSIIRNGAHGALLRDQPVQVEVSDGQVKVKRVDLSPRAGEAPNA